MELPAEIAAVRGGEGNPAALVGEFRRTPVLVPVIDDGLMAGDFRGICWIYAFTDEDALARFAAGLDTSSPLRTGEREYVTLLGAHLLDEAIPSLDMPAGVALDVADEDSSMLFPPVMGIVPEAAAVDAESAAVGIGQGGQTGAEGGLVRDD